MPEGFSSGPPDGVAKLNAIVDALDKGVIVNSEDFSVEHQPDGRVLLTLTYARPLPPATTAGGGDTFCNTRQEFTANCPDGYTGDPATGVVEAGELCGYASQAAADAAALAEAQTRAEAALVCVFACEVSLVCDSISASKSKCGFSQFTTPSPVNHKYLVNTYQEEHHICVQEGTCSCGEGEPTTYCDDYHNLITHTYDPDTCGVTDALVSCYKLTGSCCEPQGTLGCNGEFTGLPYSVISATYREWTNSPPFTTGSETYSYTLSSEFTTASLIDKTVALLPAYSGYYDCDYPEGFTPEDGQGCDCSATRNLSSDETSYSIERFKHKFTFPEATVSFTIHWVERFTPEGGGSPTDTAREETQDIGDTESSEFEVLEPDADGTTTIEDVTCAVP